MLKAVLIDDEKNALEVLEWQIKTFCPQLKVVALCNNADDGIAAIKTHAPGIVFLDIEMPVKNGFEVLRAFSNPNFDVIFTTAYDQFAIKAFKFAAFDYLLKPIDAEDLKASVSRYLDKTCFFVKEQFEMLLSQYVQPKQVYNRIALQTADGLMMVNNDEVVRCQSISNYTKIFLTNNRQLVIAKTLKEAEEMLAAHCFYRIHHSHLVNINHVLRFVRTDGGHITMTDGAQLAVARNRKDGFIAQFSHL